MGPRGFNLNLTFRPARQATVSLTALYYFLACVFLHLACPTLAGQQNEDSLIIETIISRLQAGEKVQRQKLHDVTFSGSLYERRLKGDGEIKEEKRFDHLTHLRRDSDTVRKMDIHENYLRYFKNGKIQKDEKLRKEVKNRLKKKKKGGSNNIFSPLSDAFANIHRHAYRYAYGGLTDTLVEGYICHIIEVSVNPDRKDKNKKTRIEGVYYLDTLSCRITRVDFRPAKLDGGLVFKLKEVHMTLTYNRVNEYIWLPNYFHVTGSGKAALFFSIRFEREGTYENPIINSGLPDSLFWDPISVGSL